MPPLGLLVSMRTSMNLPDSLLEAVRARAASEDRTVTSVMEEALRALLDRVPDQSPTAPLPTDGLPHGRMLIDLDDKHALANVLDADGFR